MMASDCSSETAVENTDQVPKATLETLKPDFPKFLYRKPKIGSLLRIVRLDKLFK